MKRSTALFCICFILLLFFSGTFSLIHAQQLVTKNQISSDLSLDLKLAEDNPSPDQKTLASQTVQKTEEVTTTGQEVTVAAQDTVSVSAKTESSTVAMHPDQTSSEQVVEVPVLETVNESGTPVPTSETSMPSAAPSVSQEVTPSISGEVVPGTSILQPDDNAAPMDNSTNPNLPAPTSADNGISATPTDGQNMPSDIPTDTPTPSSDTNATPEIPTDTLQPTDVNPTQSTDQPTPSPTTDQTLLTPTQPTVDQPTTDQTAPTEVPTQTVQPTSDQNPTPTDSETSNSSDNASPTDTPSVQGVATMGNVSFFQIMQQTVGNLFHSMQEFFTK